MGSTKLIVRVDLEGSRQPMIAERAVMKKYDNIKLIGADCTTDDETIIAAKNADIIITNEAYITEKVMRALPRLKGVVRYGIGYDRVDIDAASALKIKVVNVPDFCLEEVSNHVIMFILASCKKLVTFSNMIHKGEWQKARDMQKPMGSVYGQNLGIVGLGNLGKSVAQKASALGLNVFSCSEHLTVEDSIKLKITKVSWNELFEISDYISVNAALNKSTFHSISSNEFNRMKSSGIIINTSRGSVIDEHALIKALSENVISGACLDVIEHEPCSADNPLVRFNNVMMTPHTAAYSDNSFFRMETTVMEEAIRICLGENPINQINKNI